MNRSRAFWAVPLLAAATAVAAADTTVYRCKQPNGRFLYTDVPCGNADVIELQPGRADPAAAQRLAKAQAELDAGMERLRFEQARAAAEREAFAQQQAIAQAMQPPEPAPVVDYWPVYGGWVGPVRPVRPRPLPIIPPKHAGAAPRPPVAGKGPRPPRPEPLPR